MPHGRRRSSAAAPRLAARAPAGTTGHFGEQRSGARSAVTLGNRQRHPTKSSRVPVRHARDSPRPQQNPTVGDIFLPAPYVLIEYLQRGRERSFATEQQPRTSCTNHAWRRRSARHRVANHRQGPVRPKRSSAGYQCARTAPHPAPVQTGPPSTTWPAGNRIRSAPAGTLPAPQRDQSASIPMKIDHQLSVPREPQPQALATGAVIMSVGIVPVAVTSKSIQGHESRPAR